MPDSEENKLHETETESETESKSEHKLLEMHESEKKPLISPKARKEIFEWVRSLAVALVVVLVIRSFLFVIIRVDGPSMSDTLLNGDRLFVTVADVKLHGPDRFDVVILHYPNRTENFVKRVIGLPGDEIVVENGVLTINGVTYDEPYLSDERTTRFDHTSFSITLGEDEYFVMGDNRDNSNDSRSASVGVINRSMFIGKVRQIIWPFTRWDGVEGSEVYNTP
ncbi:MAG: signal peptidase I [Clostridia bacterium]|nr:signal peptidase I [Clostridia bacterium]